LADVVSRRRRRLPWADDSWLDVLCAPCLAAGRRRRLARFDQVFIDGQLSPNVQLLGRRQNALDAVPGPLWTTGPDGSEKFHLYCTACGHEVQALHERITAELGNTHGPRHVAW
jgi:hypothetical protein